MILFRLHRKRIDKQIEMVLVWLIVVFGISYTIPLHIWIYAYEYKIFPTIKSLTFRRSKIKVSITWNNPLWWDKPHTNALSAWNTNYRCHTNTQKSRYFFINMIWLIGRFVGRFNILPHSFRVNLSDQSFKLIKCLHFVNVTWTKAKTQKFPRLFDWEGQKEERGGG